jgi:hypothetical protein
MEGFSASLPALLFEELKRLTGYASGFELRFPLKSSAECPEIE